MSIYRSVGLETEYGIIDAENPNANPIQLSSDFVNAYAEAGSGAAETIVRWDYTSEDPLADARGFRISRASADPSQLTDNPNFLAPSGPSTRDENNSNKPGEINLDVDHLRRPSEAELLLPQAANTVLKNGARLYVDHAHPEYSAPEVMTPREAVIWDRAGDLIAQEAMEILRAQGKNYVIYKNNVDGKGAAYGSHENYLVKRDLDFADIIRYVTPFFVTRQIICGAGRVGLGQKSEYPGFQISQRADYVENEVGLETTFNRPIINTRDEAHADAELYRRFHVIGGDANQFDVSNLLKVGTTSLLLWLLEQDEIPMELDSVLIDEPVAATWQISHDPTLQTRIDLHDGRQLTAVEVQEIYFEVIADALAAAGVQDPQTAEVMARWREVLDAFNSDISRAAGQVEWVAKYLTMEGMRSRANLTWDDDRLRALDLQWHDLRPDKSIVSRLRAMGNVETLVSEKSAQHGVGNAPESTRAYLRGGLIRRFGKDVPAASWDSVTLDLPEEENLVRLRMLHPTEASAAAIGQLLETSASAAEFYQHFRP
ncbi:MAG: depupylase/deamidase Dop [Arcanobacterium sp.]|nr:depupylase/deamidase Dop [Arcanobacterium sp.]